MNLSLALAAALLGSAPAAVAPIQEPASTAVSASAVERPSPGRIPRHITIKIAQSCDAGRFIIASWCPQPGLDVTGGLERVITVKTGDTVVLRLVNPAGLPDFQHGIGTHSFQLTAAEPLESCVGDACRAFGVYERLPLGTEVVVRFVVDKPGRYKYFDSAWTNGYGLLVVER